MDQELLTREAFRNGVFERDRHRCVICGEPGQDAHHITERRLFPDGGYYIDNGATLCGKCHLKAESTEISVNQILEAINVSQRILPPHLYGDQDYDKWGNPILSSGQRLPGELWDDESVRKALGPVLHTFISRVKYPRTYHLPYSPGRTADDRIIQSFRGFEDQEVVVTEKMDGENTTWYSDYCHARSLDYESHPSRDRVKAMWAERAFNIPDNYRICGENLYAKHSISYSDLNSYFYVFGVWNGMTCLSWDETAEWAALLDLDLVHAIYRGPWNESLVRQLCEATNPETREGLVVRVTRQFHYKEFRHVVAKYVRANHVQTHGHWMRSVLIPNKLKGMK